MIDAMVAGAMLDMELSADGWFEAIELAQQVHFEDARDTYRFALMFADSLATERERYAAALARHDLLGAAESAAEQRDLTALLCACTDHLRGIEMCDIGRSLDCTELEVDQEPT